MMTRPSVLLVLLTPLAMPSVGVAQSLAIPAVEKAVAPQAVIKTYRGLALDGHGEPLAGVAVCVVPKDRDWLPEPLLAAATVHSNERGAFVLELSADDPRDEVLLGMRGRARVVQYIKRLDMWPVRLLKAGALSGQVRSEHGKPLAGVRVVATDFLLGLPILYENGHGNHQERLHAAALTDARGRFLIRGCYDTAVRLTVLMDGFRQLAVGPVSKLDPLTLEMEAVEVVTGLLRLPDGEPAGAGFVVRAKLNKKPYSTTLTYTNKDGRFTCAWLGESTRYSVSVATDVGRLFGHAQLNEPGPCSIVLALGAGERHAPKTTESGPSPVPAPRLVQPEQYVEVTAMLPDGTPCKQFRAAAFTTYRSQPDTPVIGLLPQSAMAAVDGVVTAPVYKSQGTGGLLLLASAKGCAMARLFLKARSKTAQIQFEKAKPIAGTVVDARTGKPVAGARLWFALFSDREHRTSEAVVTAEVSALSADDGTFSIVRAPIGEGRLFVAKDGFDSITRDLADAVERDALTLDFEPLVTIPGQVTQLPIPGSMIGARLYRSSRHSRFDVYTDIIGIQRFSRTGAVQFPGQAPGKVQLEVVVQRLPRQGRPDKVPLDTIEIDHDTKFVDVDASPAIPAIVRGRVSGPVPAQRLAVLCATLPKRGTFYAYLQYDGPLCPLAIDGSYELQAPSGKGELLVIDIATGVMFARTQVTLAPGEKAIQDFAIKSHKLLVKVECAPAQRPPDGWFVEFVPNAEYWPAKVGQISQCQSRVETYCKGMGIRVPLLAAEASIWLPETSGLLALRQYSKDSGVRAFGKARMTRSIDAAQGRVITLTW